MSKTKQIILILVYAAIGLVSTSSATVFDKAGVVTPKSSVTDGNDPNGTIIPPVKNK